MLQDYVKVDIITYIDLNRHYGGINLLLVVDVGNTNIKLGIFRNKLLDFSVRLATDRDKTTDEYAIAIHSIFNVYKVPWQEIDGAIISSVVPQITTEIADAVKLLTGVDAKIIGPGIKTGLNILINNPATCGADMVANCVGAIALYGAPTIIFSLGTATTINVIDKDKNMLGGAIIPGVITSLNALTSTSALLSAIGLTAPNKVIGKSTDECMRSGSVIGTAAMLDGMCDRIEKELGYKCTAVATGGLARVIVSSCNHNVQLCTQLTLEGLRIIYEKNL